MACSWLPRGSNPVAPLTIWFLLCGCLPLALSSSHHVHLVQRQQHINRSLGPILHQAQAIRSLQEVPAGLDLASLPQHAAATQEAAALPAGAAAQPSLSSSSGESIAAFGHTQQHSRQVLHLEATDSADSIDTAAAAEAADVAEWIDQYPRDQTSVRKYLLEGLKGGPQEIPVWFVVVTDPREPRSIISQPQAEQQIQLLNRAYATGLPDRVGAVSEDAAPGAGSRQLWRFRLLGVRYTSSKTPMCIGSRLEDQIKSQWHPQLIETTRNAAGQRGYSADRTLIIYTSDLTSPRCKGFVPGYKALFGWSNTPMELQAWKQRNQAYRDGVVLDFRYLYHADNVANEAGGKSLRGASTGAQLVHEVGHYLGLLHTFVGGCSNSGAVMTDGVDDTPAEAHPRLWGVDLGDASGGCRPRDTCPGVAGEDAVNNYMSYNNLACASTFTPGQQARMLYLFTSMRAGATH